MEPKADTKLYPAWKEAVQSFMNSGFKYGEVVPLEWFYGAFDLKMPYLGLNYEEIKTIEFAFLSAFKHLEEELLFSYRIALKNRRGVGYEVLKPNKQTKWAEAEGMKEIFRGMKRMHQRLVNVDASQLTYEEKKENSDAIAKQAHLANMLRSAARKKIEDNVMTAMPEYKL